MAGLLRRYCLTPQVPTPAVHGVAVEYHMHHQMFSATPAVPARRETIGACPGTAGTITRLSHVANHVGWHMGPRGHGAIEVEDVSAMNSEWGWVHRASGLRRTVDRQWEHSPIVEGCFIMTPKIDDKPWGKQAARFLPKPGGWGEVKLAQWSYPRLGRDYFCVCVCTGS